MELYRALIFLGLLAMTSCADAQSGFNIGVYYSATSVELDGSDEFNRSLVKTVMSSRQGFEGLSPHSEPGAFNALWGIDPYGREQIFIHNNFGSIEFPEFGSTDSTAGVITISPKFGKFGSEHPLVRLAGFEVSFVHDAAGIAELHLGGHNLGIKGSHAVQTLGYFQSGSVAQLYYNGQTFTAPMAPPVIAQGFLGNLPTSPANRFAGGIHELWVSDQATEKQWFAECERQQGRWSVPLQGEREVFVVYDGDSLMNPGDGFASTSMGIVDQVQITVPHDSFNMATPGNGVGAIRSRIGLASSRAAGYPTKIAIVSCGANNIIAGQGPGYVAGLVEQTLTEYEQAGFATIFIGLHTITKRPELPAVVIEFNALMRASTAPSYFLDWEKSGIFADLDQSGVHHTQPGYQARAEWVAEQILELGLFDGN